MAHKGYTFGQILSHYYPSSELSEISVIDVNH